MRIPSFSAEASLYKTSMRYSLATQWASTVGIHAVYAARYPVCETSCGCDTYDFGVPGTCAKLCIDRPRGDPYPVECDPKECKPPCDKPICGACTQTCNYPGGSPFTQSC
jgi:hypothetical protein